MLKTAKATSSDPTVMAMSGCSTRRRMRKCAVGCKSCFNPAARDADGNKVSPSAVTAPLTPKTKVAKIAQPASTLSVFLLTQAQRLADGSPPSRQRKRGEQQESIDEMNGDKRRARLNHHARRA
jgi:hypothetical protein